MPFRLHALLPAAGPAVARTTNAASTRCSLFANSASSSFIRALIAIAVTSAGPGGDQVISTGFWDRWRPDGMIEMLNSATSNAQLVQQAPAGRSQLSP